MRRLAACILMCAVSGCGGGDSPGDESGATPDSSARLTVDGGSQQPSITFDDATERTGVDFEHDASVQGDYTYPELVGPGAAWLDYDNDGDVDLYLVQGGQMPGAPYGEPGPNVLLRNTGGTFEPVADAAGANDAGFGMGAIAADYDNDGDADLFITNVGRNVLYRNDDGVFTDVTEASGLGDDESFSLSACFVDLDLDGHLDLYVTNYVSWTFGRDPFCGPQNGVQDYCGPHMYQGAADVVYRNLGDGRFENRTDTSGVGDVAMRSMGVVSADFDDDGDFDLFVANDGQYNNLWLNEGDFRFADEGALRGVSVSRSGAAEASMGVASEDLDRDGDFDLYCTHLLGQTNTFYRNDRGFFEDDTVRAALGAWNFNDTGFGVGFLDADNDGLLDLFVANGGVMRPLNKGVNDNPYHQRNRLAKQEASGRFVDVTDASGSGLQAAEMSRGAAFADYDGDGLVDICVTNNRGPARLLRNSSAGTGRWIGIKARGTIDNRDGIGTVVRIVAGDLERIRLVAPHQSYLCSHEPTVHFGLGEYGGEVDVIAMWPSGGRERFAGLAIDRVHEIVQGEGMVIEGDSP